MTPDQIAALRAAAQAVLDTQGHDPELHDYMRAMAGIHPQDVLALLDRLARVEAENADMRTSVVAFCAPWAVQYAAEHGLPVGTLFSTHYDILQRAGARMDDFTRHEEPRA